MTTHTRPRPRWETWYVLVPMMLASLAAVAVGMTIATQISGGAS